MKLSDFGDIRRRSAREVIEAVSRLPARSRTERVIDAVGVAVKEEWWRGFWTGRGHSPGGDINPPDHIPRKPFRQAPRLPAARRDPTPGIAYSLDSEGNVASRYATPEEMWQARGALRRATSHARLLVMSSCWVCCPASRNLLENLHDGFAFRCATCDRIYCQGVDLGKVEK